VQIYLSGKILIRIQSVFQKYDPNYGKVLYLEGMKNPSKNPRSG